jgi:hypothetical protein
MGKKTYALNGVPLLRCDRNSLCTRGQVGLIILIKVLTQQLQELLGVLSDDLSNLGVASGNLLQNGLEHVGLLLHELAKLLEVGVAAEEVQVGKGIVAISGGSTASTSTTSTTGTTAITSLGSRLEQIHGLLTTRGAWGGRNGRNGSSRLLLLLLPLLLFLLHMFGNALPEAIRP